MSSINSKGKPPFVMHISNIYFKLLVVVYFTCDTKQLIAQILLENQLQQMCNKALISKRIC